MLPGSSEEVYAGTDKGLLIIGDTISPTVTDSYPPDQSTNILVGGPFWVTFSEFMNHSATEAAFSLIDDNSIKVDGSFSWEGLTLKFSPNETLKPGIQYSMRVDTNASDLSLNQLSQAFQSDFETSGSWIHSTDPNQGALSVPTSNLNIVINFTRAMDPNSTENAFCLQVDPNFDPGSQCLNGIFNWGNGNQRLEFTPSENLDYETKYILTIDASAKDQNGISIPQPFNLGFKTESLLPESWIDSTYPTQGAQSITTSNLNVVINFTRAMDPNSTENAFCLQIDPNFDPGSQCLSGIFNWDNGNQRLEFTPSDPLDGDTNYVLTIVASARDQNGISIPQPFNLGFETESILPESWIHSTYPAQGEESIPTSNIIIIINFTRSMDPDLTENAFCLKVDPNFDPGSQCLSGNSNWYNNNQRLEFTPSENLDDETNYILTIDASAKDQNGEPIPGPFALRFKTISAQRTLTFEGIGCFIQSLEHKKSSIFMRLKDWLNFNK
jgi:hypothetical protein